jgi:hypothetical protein
MKKFLAIFGVIFFVIVLVVVAVIGYAAFIGNKFDASSKAYVDESIPAIVSSWSKDELIKRASPQLRRKTSDVQIGQLFNALSGKLGSFQSYEGAKGQSSMSLTSKDGQVTTASYVANATFRNGKAEIQIKLIRYDDSWQILGFHVELSPR